MVSRLKFRGRWPKGGGLRIFKIQGGGFQKGGVEKFRGVWTPDEAMLDNIVTVHRLDAYCAY